MSDRDSVINGYGSEPNLQDILEQLGLYCRLATGKEVKAKVILPDAVVDHFTSTCLRSPAVVQRTADQDAAGRYVAWTTGGVIEIVKESEA